MADGRKRSTQIKNDSATTGETTMSSYSLDQTTRRLTEVTPAEWDALRSKMNTTDKEDDWERLAPSPDEVVDLVNKPPHYNHGKIEAIDYLRDSLGENVSYYYEGSVKKYLHRWRYKSADDVELQKQDLLKAEYYLKKLIESL